MTSIEFLSLTYINRKTRGEAQSHILTRAKIKTQSSKPHFSATRHVVMPRRARCVPFMEGNVRKTQLTVNKVKSKHVNSVSGYLVAH